MRLTGILRTVLCGSLVCASSGAAEFKGTARVWLGPGFDSNARRDFVTSGLMTQADGFLYGLGTAEGAVLGERFQLRGAYDVAGRVFFGQPSENTVVNSATGDFSFGLTSALNVGLVGSARDRRGAERDYTNLLGQGAIDFIPTENFDLRLRVGANRFLFWQRFRYSFSGPVADVSARYRFDRRHSVSVTGLYNPRTYNAVPNPRPDDQPTAAPRRFDPVFNAGASYSFRGPFQLSVGYSYLDQTSNSFGETLRRHRLSVTGGVRLPAKLMLLAAGALQLSQYPDGIFLSPDLQVVEDDENSSSLSVKLVLPAHRHIDLDARYALVVNVLPQRVAGREPLVYVRHVFSIGVTLSF